MTPKFLSRKWIQSTLAKLVFSIKLLTISHLTENKACLSKFLTVIQKTLLINQSNVGSKRQTEKHKYFYWKNSKENWLSVATYVHVISQKITLYSFTNLVTNKRKVMYIPTHSNFFLSETCATLIQQQGRHPLSCRPLQTSILASWTVIPQEWCQQLDQQQL